MQQAGTRVRLTGSEYARWATHLRTADRKGLGSGPPSILGCTKYCLDLSGVPPGDKHAAVIAAIVKCQTTLPEGSALQLGKLDEQQIQRFFLRCECYKCAWHGAGAQRVTGDTARWCGAQSTNTGRVAVEQASAGEKRDESHRGHTIGVA